METRQIRSLVHLFVFNSTISERDTKTLQSKTVHLALLTAGALIIYPKSKSFSWSPGLRDNQRQWVLPVVTYVWLDRLMVFPVWKDNQGIYSILFRSCQCAICISVLSDNFFSEL